MILLTGGSGLLGGEIQKWLNPLDCLVPSSKQLDITKTIKPYEGISLIIHCAAYTDVVKAEDEYIKCFDVNVIGTINLLKAYPKAKFVYISSEYAKNPLNVYSWTKALAETAVSNHSKHLIIRTSFSARPFPHKKAFKDQYTQGDYVDKIARLIYDAIEVWDLNNLGSRLIYIGTGRKTMLQLARQTKPNIEANSIKDIKAVRLPKDYV